MYFYIASFLIFAGALDRIGPGSYDNDSFGGLPSLTFGEKDTRKRASPF